MNKITPFLWFNNNVDKAVKFYRPIFKQTKVLNVYHNGKKFRGLRFRINGQELLGFNLGPHFKFTPALSIFVSCKTQKEVDFFYERLSRGGKKKPCGWVEDPFGLHWQIVPDVLMKLSNDKDAKKAKRVFQAMLKMTKLDIEALRKAAREK